MRIISRASLSRPIEHFQPEFKLELERILKRGDYVEVSE
jgi:hypothetical protein